MSAIVDYSRTRYGNTYDNWNNTMVPIGPRSAGTYVVGINQLKYDRLYLSEIMHYSRTIYGNIN